MAGERKYQANEMAFLRVGAEVHGRISYRWGVVETDNTIKRRHADSVTFKHEELVTLLTAGERSTLQTIFAKLQTAAKVKDVELTDAVEE